VRPEHPVRSNKERRARLCELHPAQSTRYDPRMGANEAINSVFQDVIESISTGRPQGFVIFAMILGAIAGVAWVLDRIGLLR
jgi:hypothetical protein